MKGERSKTSCPKKYDEFVERLYEVPCPWCGTSMRPAPKCSFDEGAIIRCWRCKKLIKFTGEAK